MANSSGGRSSNIPLKQSANSPLQVQFLHLKPLLKYKQAKLTKSIKVKVKLKTIFISPPEKLNSFELLYIVGSIHHVL